MEEERWFMEERQRYEEEVYQREQEEYIKEQEQSHWGCSFFKHCWNEGLKLLAKNNYPECSAQYSEYRQSRANRHPIHERLGIHFSKNDRHLKIDSFES
jgi:hypothetical protein